jgi:hypothetical protein
MSQYCILQQRPSRHTRQQQRTDGSSACVLPSSTAVCVRLHELARKAKAQNPPRAATCAFPDVHSTAELQHAENVHSINRSCRPPAEGAAVGC